MKDQPSEHAPASRPEAQRFARLAEKINSVGVFRFLQSIEPLVLVVALLTFVVTSVVGFTAIHETRAARFWDLLLHQSGRGVGQLEALEYLNRPRPRYFPQWFPLSKRTNFATIDLTSPTSTSTDTITAHGTKEETCHMMTKTNLRGIKLPGAILDNAKLNCTNLEHANLRAASLVSARLQGTNLGKADLRDALMAQAYMIHADLSGARLERAHLVGVVLRSADLVGANLSGANLERVNLVDANLWEATLDDAILSKANLEGVEGLDCDRLRRAHRWEEAVRDEELACGESIPSRSDDT